MANLIRRRIIDDTKKWCKEVNDDDITRAAFSDFLPVASRSCKTGQ